MFLGLSKVIPQSPFCTPPHRPSLPNTQPQGIQLHWKEFHTLWLEKVLEANGFSPEPW